MDTEIFNFDALERAYNEAQKDYEREHVTPYIFLHPEIFKIKSVEAIGKLRRPDLRFTVDTEEDLLLIREIYSALGNYGNHFSTKDVLALIDGNRYLLSINKHIVQKDIHSS